MKKCLLIVFLLTVSLGCTGGNNFLDAINAVTMITGRVIVYDSTTGTNIGLAGAKVLVRVEDKYEESVTLADDPLTTINETGLFFVDSVLAAARGVQVVVSADGYSNYITSVNTYIANVDPLRHNDLGDLTLVKSAGTLSGTVFGVDGPLAGVKVVCMNSRAEAGGFTSSATTDASGNFSIANVPETSSYVCSNLPFDVNSDGFYDYASDSATVDLSMFAGQTAKVAYLVLPGISATFDIIFSNIGHGWDATTGMPTSLAENDSISLYFNNVVSNDSNLWVTLTDPNGNIVPVTTSASNNAVTVVPQNNFSYGYSYTFGINARSIIGEEYTLAGQTFWVRNDTSPSAISDFAISWADTNTKNGTTSKATFDELVGDPANLGVSLAMTFSLPSNYTNISLHIRSDDADSVNSHFDFGTNLDFTIASPTDYAAAGTACSLSVPCANSTGDYFVANDLSSGKTTAEIVVGSLAAYFTDVQYTGETRKVYLALRACNDQQISTALPDYSDNCVMSNVVELSYTK